MRKPNTVIFQNGKLLLNCKTNFLICFIIDPSHITGDRVNDLEVTQEALDLNYDG
jgi:hypothetical protein